MRATSPTSGSSPRRPRAVLVLMVIVVLQALLLMGVGALLVAVEVGPGAAVDATIDARLLDVAGALVALVGLAQLALVFLLGRASEVARSLFGGLAVVETAAGVYSTVALRDFEVAVILPLVFSVLVLWLLYGSDDTREFFLS